MKNKNHFDERKSLQSKKSLRCGLISSDLILIYQSFRKICSLIWFKQKILLCLPKAKRPISKLQIIPLIQVACFNIPIRRKLFVRKFKMNTKKERPRKIFVCYTNLWSTLIKNPAVSDKTKHRLKLNVQLKKKPTLLKLIIKWLEGMLSQEQCRQT